MDSITYVGLDVHKATVCVALPRAAAEARSAKPGFENHPEIVLKLAAR
jgi:hypothetical protein